MKFLCATALLLPQLVFAATITGKLVSGGGIDNLEITVKAPGGKTVSAYCSRYCGDWFITGDHEISRLKRKLMGRKVVMTYQDEKNRGRLAGPDDDDIYTFVKKVELLP